jgi:hypothetical protein
VLASLVSRAILASFGFAWAHAAVKTAVFLFPASFSARATKKSCQVLRTMVSFSILLLPPGRGRSTCDEMRMVDNDHCGDLSSGFEAMSS